MGGAAPWRDRRSLVGLDEPVLGEADPGHWGRGTVLWKRKGNMGFWAQISVFWEIPCGVGVWRQEEDFCVVTKLSVHP